MILNRFPQNNREKLVVPRRRYVHILGHIAEANVTFRGKGGTAEHVTDFVFKIGTKRSLFRRRRGDPMWSPVYIPQYKKRKKHRLRVTPSFAWAQFVHSALFSQSPAVAHTCSLSNAKQALRLVAFGASLAAFYEFKPLSIMYLLAQFIRLSLIIRIDGGRCVKKRGKNIFFYIADMSRVFAHAVKNIENMPVMKL